MQTRHFNRPYGTSTNRTPASPALKCWATVNRPYGTEVGFARPEEAEVYMGVHVSLTGVRGLIMPAVGMVLYLTIGWTVWLLGVAFSLVAVWGFYSLSREEAG